MLSLALPYFRRRGWRSIFFQMALGGFGTTRGESMRTARPPVARTCVLEYELLLAHECFCLLRDSCSSWMNYGQETELKERNHHMEILGAQNAFAYHYRGGTLPAGPCKNGWLDCASWQVGHRPDMKSTWWDPSAVGLNEQ